MSIPDFLVPDQVREVQRRFGTPVYVYDQATLEAAADELLQFPAPFAFTARYAMKALPTTAIVQLFDRKGLHIDASSGYEVERALRAGVAPEKIQVTAQQLPSTMRELIARGVLFNATSVHQLRVYGEFFPGTDVSIRVNPGLGSGHSNRTNVGGPSSSFGIWHEHLSEVEAVRRQFGLRITGLHTHIGSGTDPNVWQRCARMTLGIAAKFPDVNRLSFGGGFKVARMPGESTADLAAIGRVVSEDVQAYAREHGRELHIELEPGTWLVANAGAVVATVVDVVDTGSDGYAFVKTDTGMTELLRISHYGAQQPMTIVPATDEPRPEREYIVVGHCCESGDILTPSPGDPESLLPRRLPEARIGDALVVGGAGAYCSGMTAKNYNSFPEAPEVLLTDSGDFVVIRQRQTLDQTLENEAPLPVPNAAFKQ